MPPFGPIIHYSLFIIHCYNSRRLLTNQPINQATKQPINMPLKTQIKDILISREEITAAFIYGSSLHTDDYRDIDIGIFTRDSIEGLARQDLEFEIEQLLREKLSGVEFDVRILNDAPDRFLFTVFKGEFLFSRDDKVEELMEHVIHKCLDEQYYIDQYYRQAYGD